MAMSPGMKMMMVQRAAQDRSRNSSEYGGGRKMIGYDRAENGQSNTNMMYGGSSNMMYGGVNNNGGNMAYGSPIGNPHMAYGNAGEVPQYANNYGPVEGPRTGTQRNEEVYRSNRGYEGRGGTEARRRRDSRGRYMMGGMEEEDDDEEKRSQTWYPPYGGMKAPSMHGGSRYKNGDIYAEIYAPNAMNRHMRSMMEEDMARPVDEHTARKWVDDMSGGEKFKSQMAEQLRSQICPDCEKWEFYVALNAMYSDYCRTAKEMGVDRPEYFAMMARDFLEDEDAGPYKLRKYMETIPKK